MARRNKKVKGSRYSYEKELKKVIKNPKKRLNAGIVVFINGKDMEYPPRIVDISDDIVEAKELKIPKRYFEDSQISINGFPAILIKGNDIMTSAGLYYNKLIPVKGEYSAPEQIYMDGYYTNADNNKLNKYEGRRPILETFQPSQTMPPSIMEGMVYSMAKVGDIKEWLKKNKTLIYMAIGTVVAAGLAAYFSYQIYSEKLPQVISICSSVAKNCGTKVAEVIPLG